MTKKNATALRMITVPVVADVTGHQGAEAVAGHVDGALRAARSERPGLRVQGTFTAGGGDVAGGEADGGE